MNGRRRKPSVDTRVERRIIIGMIVSDRFLREIQPVIGDGYGFKASFAGSVAEWCMEYWEHYGKAPGRNIEDIFLNKQKDIPDEDQARLIEEFLSSINEEYEQTETFNVPFILDEAERYFRLSALKTLRDDINQHIVGGRIEEAEQMVKEYQRPSRPQMRGVDPLRDTEFILAALRPDDENPDVMFSLPGELGRVVGPMERGMLMAVQAESGVGKTWWLLFLTRMAVWKGFGSAFFSLEMKETKMGRRMWQDIAGKPVKGKQQVPIPVFDCHLNQNGECSLDKRKGRVSLMKDGKLPPPEHTPKDYIACDACRGDWTREKMTTWWVIKERDYLEPASAIHRRGALDRTGILKKAGVFHLVEYPADSLTVPEMRSYINNLRYYDGLDIDVIVTDYADKFKWEIVGDPRNSIGRIWGGHKSIAQEDHCLVITASQSNTERSGATVGRRSWSETIEKRRVLDLGIALNQKSDDYERGIMIASVDKIRDGEAVMTTDVAVLQQLAIGRPYLDSCVVRRSERKK